MLSEQFSCQVEHSWYMADVQRNGYDRYDRGEHVGGGRISTEAPESEVIYLTYADNDSVPLSPNSVAG
ncbi:Uncharacterised protein [Serratia plymuthica]|uniref:Uncharacterized protein n=1 Tax=Serratia plymuthica TaxID=82996 RepID=A0A2X4UZ11_SERPL|nr:Uncharacterised protein [Serratia plymuthica]CAI2415340.1 Uncharacterised protein [Serratia plymuthica]SQI45126.1 Uncharacterised protein [Serratia plymuthica]